ncbi:hypothetical protein BT67DRAFT_64800 [Trichocladium antarcticum]|uniref:Uncharacterized protein n=1 Tax=Trichocladium antarcticum TaxID=1450529 RepID=A0AAN6UHU2_9PEZI|nr:hypothetical protein BT67DRAFT_64800 [Trichocladium antarcticum]
MFWKSGAREGAWVVEEVVAPEPLPEPLGVVSVHVHTSGRVTHHSEAPWSNIHLYRYWGFEFLYGTVAVDATHPAPLLRPPSPSQRAGLGRWLRWGFVSRESSRREVVAAVQTPRQTAPLRVDTHKGKSQARERGRVALPLIDRWTFGQPSYCRQAASRKAGSDTNWHACARPGPEPGEDLRYTTSSLVSLASWIILRPEYVLASWLNAGRWGCICNPCVGVTAAASLLRTILPSSRPCLLVHRCLP